MAILFDKLYIYILKLMIQVHHYIALNRRARKIGAYYGYDQTCMREHVWGMVCIGGSNMVVVVNCDNNFISTMVFTNSFCYLTRKKKNAYAKILIDS
jgi:hypothetical protein